MQMVKKLALALLLVWFAVILFMPREDMYFTLEHELAKHEIEINEENRSEGLFSLRLEHVTVYVKGISLITIEEINFFTLLFYSNVKFNNIFVDESLKSMSPTEINELTVSHTILSPAHIQLAAAGIFGQTTGTIDISKRNIHLDFNETKKLDMLRSQLKQGEKGWYYEKSF